MRQLFFFILCILFLSQVQAQITPQRPPVPPVLWQPYIFPYTAAEMCGLIPRFYRGKPIYIFFEAID